VLVTGIGAWFRQRTLEPQEFTIFLCLACLRFPPIVAFPIEVDLVVKGVITNYV
jgi:hypothetical protein